MNKYDFKKQGGFPLDQNVLGFMQDNIFLASNAAWLAGDLAILSGCVVSGTSVSDGVVSINGEILPFVQSSLGTNVVIIETAQNLTYEDGKVYPSEVSRYATIGNGPYEWPKFKRNTSEGILSRLERLERIAAPFLATDSNLNNPNPHGAIVLWGKPASVPLPTGWREVIDMRGYMPVGFKTGDVDFGKEIGTTGGAREFSISRSNLPNIKLSVSGVGSAVNGVDWDDTGGHGSGYFKGNVQTDALGDGTPVKFLNPFRIVMFIEYIGG